MKPYLRPYLRIIDAQKRCRILVCAISLEELTYWPVSASPVSQFGFFVGGGRASDPVMNQATRSQRAQAATA